MVRVKAFAALESPAAALPVASGRDTATPDRIPVGTMDTPAAADCAAATAPEATGRGRVLPGVPVAAVELSPNSGARPGT